MRSSRTTEGVLRRRTLYPAELQRLIQLLMPLVSNYWRDLGGDRSVQLSYGGKMDQNDVLEDI